MHRFFVSPEHIDGDSIKLSGEVAAQLARVLRARTGEEIVLLDDSGWEYVVSLDRVTPQDIHGRVTDRLRSRGEPQSRITMYQAVLKADRFELVLQKGTELGISVFVPVFCERSVPRFKGGDLPLRRRERWQKIIKEAAEQSRRGRLPVLAMPVDFPTACQEAVGLGLIPWEEETVTGLKAALERWGLDGSAQPTVSIFTGPEGGFTQQEVQLARNMGIVPVSLGRRILRSETAGLATAAAVLYESGELG